MIHQDMVTPFSHAVLQNWLSQCPV